MLSVSTELWCHIRALLSSLPSVSGLGSSSTSVIIFNSFHHGWVTEYGVQRESRVQEKVPVPNSSVQM